MQEAGATADIELAYTLADGLEYLRPESRPRISTCDSFAPRISFFWGHWHEPFHGDCQDARCAHVVGQAGKDFQSEEPEIACVANASQTSGWSLTAQDPYNNVVRTCVEALAAAFGHTQSLHTNALDEAWLCPPISQRASLAIRTIYLQEETGITRGRRPLGRFLLCRAAYA